jgi:hypothetical protein
VLFDKASQTTVTPTATKPFETTEQTAAWLQNPVSWRYWKFGIDWEDKTIEIEERLMQ